MPPAPPRPHAAPAGDAPRIRPCSPGEARRGPSLPIPIPRAYMPWEAAPPEALPLKPSGDTTDTGPCRSCGETLHWTIGSGPDRCARCHPPHYQSDAVFFERGRARRRVPLLERVQVPSYKLARRILLKVLPQLLAAGWTRARLFRMGRYVYPYGDWGVAWLGVWARPGVEPTLEDDGRIVWWFEDGGHERRMEVLP